MDLLLIRHAYALELGEEGISKNAKCPLSEKGREQTRALAAVLKERQLQPDRIVTSPYLRQTADGIAECFSSAIEIVESDALEPEGRCKRVEKLLHGLEGNRIALVGHQPDIGKWTAWLIGSTKAQINFAKAGVAYIRCGEGAGKGLGILEWLITPDWYMGRG